MKAKLLKERQRLIDRLIEIDGALGVPRSKTGPRAPGLTARILIALSESPWMVTDSLIAKLDLFGDRLGQQKLGATLARLVKTDKVGRSGRPGEYRWRAI